MPEPLLEAIAVTLLVTEGDEVDPLHREDGAARASARPGDQTRSASEDRPVEPGTTTSGSDPEDIVGGGAWKARRRAATAIRAAVLITPVGGSVAIVWFTASQVARPTGAGALLWWAAMLALAFASYWIIERLGRRLLPLAALLRLSLVFPDKTPSRYRVALLAGTTKQLERAVTESREGVEGETLAEAAQRLLLLASALNAHDRLTRGHSERVRAYAEVIGEEMGLSKGALERLRWSALLHDVGKIEVPSEILNKPGKLTDDEFEAIKVHPRAGAELVEPLREWLGDELLAVEQHHERFDGRGYPYGLSGEEISLAGRVVAVADTFDVITSARSYKKPMSPSDARLEIERCAGSQFDPAVVRALLEVSLGRLWLAGGPLAWGASVPILASVPGVGSAVPGMAGATGAGLAATAVFAGAGMAALGADHAQGAEVSATPVVQPAPERTDRSDEPVTPTVAEDAGSPDASGSKGEPGTPDADEPAGDATPAEDPSTAPAVSADPGGIGVTEAPTGAGGATPGGPGPAGPPTSVPNPPTGRVDTGAGGSGGKGLGGKGLGGTVGDLTKGTLPPVGGLVDDVADGTGLDLPNVGGALDETLNGVTEGLLGDEGLLGRGGPLRGGGLLG